MQKQKQLNKHDPENGVYGDCFRTSIACVLNMDAIDVPHYHSNNIPDGSTQVVEFRKWLASNGFGLFEICLSGELENILAHIKSTNPDEYYLLSGESSVGTDHIVICHGDKIVWDTSTQDSGIVGPRKNDGYYWISVLTSNISQEPK